MIFHRAQTFQSKQITSYQLIKTKKKKRINKITSRSKIRCLFRIRVTLALVFIKWIKIVIKVVFIICIRLIIRIRQRIWQGIMKVQQTISWIRVILWVIYRCKEAKKKLLSFCKIWTSRLIVKCQRKKRIKLEIN